VNIEENLKIVREKISRAAERAGRDPAGIRIVAVTKTHPPEVVDQAVKAGLKDVGENKVQEFLDKEGMVKEDCRWHFVGHLQRNKVNKIIGSFELIHSLDSLKLARKINKSSLREGVVTSVLVQVNTSGEESKYGIEPDEAEELCEAVSSYEGIRVKGLMTMAPWVEDRGVIRRTFSALRMLADKIRSRKIENISMDELSMGMTDDFEIAVAEGATMLRLGRVLFGPRGR